MKLLLTLLFIFSSSTFACDDLFKNQHYLDLVKLSKQDAELDVSIAFKQFNELQPKLSFLNAKEVYALLIDKEQLVLQQNLIKLINLFHQDSSVVENITSLKKVINTFLTKKVPTQMKSILIKRFFSSPNPKLSWILGAMEVEDIHFMMVGNDYLHPSTDSLVGKYLEKSQAKTLIRSFKKGPNSKVFGEEKLVIAVSPDSFPIYQKLFQNENSLIHFHTPTQGTLHVLHNGKIYNWGGGTGEELRIPSESSYGLLMPHILLSTTEATRVKNFFELMSKVSSIAMNPWQLTNYCATGAYNSCTHWFANIPIGDKTVDSYTFPGRIDNYASNNISDNPEVNKAPRTAPLHPYVVPENYKAYEDLINLVWKVPGNEPLWSLLNLKRGQISAELANPGYLLYNLLGKTSNKRIPIVFVFVDDHTKELDPNFDLQIEAY